MRLEQEKVYNCLHMIYVLFGPPGVGKTYIGELVSKQLGMKFFDADVLFDEELRVMLRSGTFNQQVRDIFFDKLSLVTEHLLTELGDSKDLIIAQAFIKEKNRGEFLHYFDEQVRYVLVNTTKDLAHFRMTERTKNGPHVVNDNVFEYAWKEFERPMVPHKSINNTDLDNETIVKTFTKVME